jgi:hypothetical protein
LIGAKQSVKRGGACVSEALLDLDGSGIGPADPTGRAQCPFQVLAHRWQAYSILASSVPPSRTPICTHHLLASIRLQPSSLREPIASDLAVDQIIRTNP